ncbi:hypothetical protein TIFTF001_025886 [Ficus carica]|uniref:Wall-associated receptor kinase C-terminal domain-containing protein n=1 Tax=Ficus carica TaxID=3494 RepID=A0AA88APG7_FICCA|nr:hypothetical protein TIFTF001_025886 [Ficus carica]
MNTSASFLSSLLFLMLFILFASVVSLSQANEDDPFKSCESFDCGVVDCESDQDSPMFDVVSQKFHVLDINLTARVLKIARGDFWDSNCPEKFINTTLSSTLLDYTSNDKNTTLLYDCDEATEFSNLVGFDCAVTNISRRAYFVVDETDLHSPEFTWPVCRFSVVVPVMEEVVKQYVTGLICFDRVFQGGFEEEWNIIDEENCKDCVGSGGRCGYNSSTTEDNIFFCFCPLDLLTDGLGCRPSL